MRWPVAVVTGGAGAVGSRVVSRLLATERADRVVVVDDLSSGYEWLLPDDPRVHLIKGDVANMGGLEVDGHGAVVFHLAAFFANQNSVDHPFDDLHTNGLGTLAVLKWAAENGAARLVYASAGCSIAGHDVDGAIREDMPVSLELSTPYQITKALGEFYCNYFLPQLETVRCRFFNSYGPGEVPGEYRNVIPNFIWKAMHDEPLTITGTGHETRDFIYVDDLVEGLVLAAGGPTASGEAFNLGTGRETEVIDLAQAIVRLTGSSSEIVYAPRRSWDESIKRQADVSKSRAVLGHSADILLEEGLAQTVEWFTQNRERIASSVRGAR